MQLIFYKMQAKIGSATIKNVVKFAVEEVRKMKFSEKLTNLRKKNNKSQEQLADKLGVSRQAVSKWESGTSVPDMEKMMQLCKILNCSLDELVDDGAGGNRKQTTQDKITWNTYYKEVIDFITKTLNMFWSMQLIEKVKCILEMLFLVLILFFAWRIIGNILYSCFYSILSLLPDMVHKLIYSISSFIYQIFGIITGLVLLVHIFKIRYLDYFITIEDQNTTEKSIEIPIEEQEYKKEEKQRQFISKNRIIIRDPKHSTYSFFGVLAKLVIWFMKLLLILFAVPCIICFIVITFLAVCSLWYIKNGIFFFGIFLTLLGALLINYLVLKTIYYFIFELKQTFQKTFTLCIIGLTLTGIGASIAFCTYLNFDKVSINDKEQITTKEELIYEDKMILSFMDFDNVTIIENNNLSNIKIETKHYKNIKPQIYSNTHYTTIMNESNECINTTYNLYSIILDYQVTDEIDEIKQLLNMLKNKERFDLNEDIYSHQITIIASKNTIDKLKKNYQDIYK